MVQYSLHDARDILEKLVHDAQQGKTVLILDEYNQAVQLVPVRVAKPRKAGSARGLIKIAPDFDTPLPDFDEYARMIPSDFPSPSPI
jgi:antitoxin (DNA-binding transcriptional repressor) of toxin-antitoxin stability system